MRTISSRDIKFYNAALNLAKISECSCKHAAIIVRGGNILALSTNKYSHSQYSRRYKSHVISIHAELRAIILASSTLQGSTLYSARISNNMAAISKPCDTCRLLMLEASIHTVVYYDKFLIKERV